MHKYLAVDIDKCVGCRICEVWCSFTKLGECGPAYSRITLYPIESEGVSVPIVCNHCEEAPCMAVCPVRALNRDSETGAVLLDDTLCIGCRACIVACPFGAIFLTPDGKLIKCDLCDGEPVCVARCPVNAITYVRPELVSISKQKSYSYKVAEPLLTQRGAAVTEKDSSLG